MNETGFHSQLLQYYTSIAMPPEMYLLADPEGFARYQHDLNSRISAIMCAYGNDVEALNSDLKAKYGTSLFAAMEMLPAEREKAAAEAARRRSLDLRENMQTFHNAENNSHSLTELSAPQELSKPQTITLHPKVLQNGRVSFVPVNAIGDYTSTRFTGALDSSNHRLPVQNQASAQIWELMHRQRAEKRPTLNAEEVANE